jgi:hypothetical protein
MHAALVLQAAVHALAFNRDDGFLQSAAAGVAARHHVELPALTLGVARVHPEQVTGKERCLVAARAGADFEDDVFLVVRILGNEQDLQVLQQGVASCGERAELLFGQLAHLRIATFGQLLGALDVLFDGLVLTELRDERLEFRQGLGGLLELAGVGLHLGRADAGHQLFVTGLNGREFVEHGFSSG